MGNKSLELIFSVIFMASWLWATTHQVTMAGLNFVPETLTVHVGDTVNWKNTGAMNHTSTSGVNGVPDGIWDSGLIVPGDSFQFAFSTQNNYPYFCTPHWQLGMTGLVIVTATGIQEGIKQRPGGSDFKVAPNPFENSTAIKSTNPAGNAGQNFIIFNLRGARVRSLNSATWLGDDDRGHQVPPGIYFIKSGAGSPVSIEKVVKLK